MTLDAISTPELQVLRSSAVHNVEAAMVIADARFPTLPLVDANGAFERLTGFSATEILGHDLRLLEGVRSRPGTLDGLARRVIAGESGQVTALHYRKDTSTFWDEITMSPVRDEDGRVSHVVAILKDVTNREQLANLNAALADLSPEKDEPEDDDVTCERAATALVPRFADHCEVFLCNEQGDLESVHSRNADARAAQAFASISPFDIQANRVRATREREPIVTTGPSPARQTAVATMSVWNLIWIPIRSNQKVLGCLELGRPAPHGRLEADEIDILRRIGVRVGADLERDRLLQAARSAINARDQFLAVVSHELRTPVASIKGYVQLLNRTVERGSLTEGRLKGALGTITTSVKRLSILIDDLLDVTRIGNTDVPLNRERIEIDPFVEEVVRRSAFLFPQRIEVRLGASGGWIDADRIKIEQVMLNLIGNASKYSPRDEGICIETMPSTDGMLIRIVDRGMGIPDDQAEHIFGAFGRSREAIAEQSAGLGLGLFICRSIVERHSGRIWPEQPPSGEGTAMNVWLPNASGDAVPASDE